MALAAAARRARARPPACRRASRPRAVPRVTACAGQPAVLHAQMSSAGNIIQVVQFPDEYPQMPILGGARILTLDHTGNLHSLVPAVAKRGVTGGYWDGFGAVAPLLAGPAPGSAVGLLGLGAGSTARLLQEHFPGRFSLVGWELDGEVVEVARGHMGLAELEESGLEVRVGDALGEGVTSGGATYAALVVDLFANGSLLPQLQDPEVWVRWANALAPGGRVMANLGGGSGGVDDAEMQGALDAMAEAFGGEIFSVQLSTGLPGGEYSMCANTLAISGPMPEDASEWAAGLPEAIRCFAHASWESYGEVGCAPDGDCPVEW
mmetsp:Transcript_24167/g.82478  ORF Transcript_24167/g.82478 Transcript_24167/m.82478 type:complete len:321 (-) Transcript_24167:961-1923(-)